MNERTNELDKAAQEYAGRIAGNDEDSNYVAWFNIYKEKFAELIVRECSNVAWQYTPDTEELEYSHLIKDKILKRFGVEE